MNISKKNILIITAALFIFITGWVASINYLQFNTIKNIVLTIIQAGTAQPVLIIITLLLIHIAGMLLSLPTKAIFTIISGSLLGVINGTAVTLAGVLTGTSALFFITRILTGKTNIHINNKKLKQFENRVSKHPVAAIAGLRMILTLPYGPITILAALGNVKYSHFILGSLLGDLPVVLLYSEAGVKLALLTSTKEAISWQTIIILSGAGIALFAGILFSSKTKD